MFGILALWQGKTRAREVDSEQRLFEKYTTVQAKHGEQDLAGEGRLVMLKISEVSRDCC